MKKFQKNLFYKIFKNKATSCFSTFMAEKKSAKKTTKSKDSEAKVTKSKTTTKAKSTKSKTTKAKVTKSKTTTKAKSTKSKAKTAKSKKKEEPVGDMGIVIVDDDIEIDQDKVNEERRAYLEEARSQEAFD